MNFEVLLQNIAYMCRNILSYLPKFTGIDLFSLYVLFFHFRPRDGAPENCFFSNLGVGSRGPVPPFLVY